MNTAGRILIADDELRNRQLLHDLLEPLGHQLTLAENGREAVEAVEARGVGLEPARGGTAPL